MAGSPVSTRSFTDPWTGIRQVVVSVQTCDSSNESDVIERHRYSVRAPAKRFFICRNVPYWYIHSMTEIPPLGPGSCIVQVNNYDMKGGAETVSLNLFVNYRSRGFRSYLFVGTRNHSDVGVREIPRDILRSSWERLLLERAGAFMRSKDNPGIARYGYLSARFLANPLNSLRLAFGGIDYDFPSSKVLLSLIPEKPDILHLHNIHGTFFDIRALPGLTHEIPVVLTIHDTFYLRFFMVSRETERSREMLSGVRKWPAGLIKRWDKKIISGTFRKSRLFITCPSRWLMDQFSASPLGTAVCGSRIIPNGVNLGIFRPFDRLQARKELGLPADHAILLFVSHDPLNNPDKDYPSLSAAVRRAASRSPGRKILFILVGGIGPNKQDGNLEFRFVPFIRDARRLARYYQAADLYIHASMTEAWGLTITEALACGIPVIATATGGIPEQVRDGFNGILTPPGDPAGMAAAISYLLDEEGIRKKIGTNAADDARARFDLEDQVMRYLQWYGEVKDSWEKKPQAR